MKLMTCPGSATGDHRRRHRRCLLCGDLKPRVHQCSKGEPGGREERRRPWRFR